MRSRLLALIFPATRVLLAMRVVMLLLAPAALAHANTPAAQAEGGWQQFPDSPAARQPITALLAAKDGEVWVGTEERGLARWDGAGWTQYGTPAGLPDMRVVSLFEDSKGRLWVGTGTGLGYFPPDGSEFRRLGKKGIPAFPVTAMAESDDGGVWFGTPLGLVAWHEDGAFEIADHLMGKRVLSLAKAGDGTLWAGTSDGLWRREAAGWQPADGPGPGGVTALGVDDQGAAVALANGQVWRLEDGQWAAVPGAFRQGANAFAFEGDKLWLVSAGQIDAFRNGFSQRYDRAPLPGGNITRIAVAPDGQIWFGTSRGLAAYRPDTVAPAIEWVRINGNEADADGVALARNQIEQIAVSAADGGAESGGTAAKPAAIFTQLDPPTGEMRVVTGEAPDTYQDVKLAPGSHTLSVWAVDEALNLSEPKRITIYVPDLTYLPLGIAIPTEVIGPLVAVAATVLLLVAGIIGAILLRRSAVQRAAAREAARVRGILEQAGNPYEGGLAYDPALRSEQAKQVVAALRERSALVLGPRGIGKTTLLRHLAAGGADDLAAAYLDLAALNEVDLFAEAIGGLYAAMTRQMIGERPRLEVEARGAGPYGEREFAADLGRLLAFARPSATAAGAALLLDNANSLDGYAGPQRDAVRRLILASGGAGALRLGLAAESLPASLEGLTDLLTPVELPPLAGPALERLLLQAAEGTFEWDAEATRGAVALSHGRPGRLREIAERAVTVARQGGRIRILRTDVAPVRSTT
jgi:hypothetical protein